MASPLTIICVYHKAYVSSGYDVFSLEAGRVEYIRRPTLFSDLKQRYNLDKDEFSDLAEFWDCWNIYKKYLGKPPRLNAWLMKT